MRILVTGGFGFIGSNFIRNTIDRSGVDYIVNVDSMTYAADPDNLDANSRIINVVASVENEDKMKQIISDHDITHVVHFAAESHVDNSIKSPGAFINTNVNGTFSLLEAVRKQKPTIRFHHVSTDEVYGSLGDQGYFTESSPYDPRSPYSASKAASDHLVRAYNHTYNIQTTISNCSNNYGPRQHVEKLIPKTITNIASGKRVPVYGRGVNVRDWIYVDDHCDAVWEVLTHGNIGDTYLVGGRCDITNLTIIEKICSLMNVSMDEAVEFVGDRPGHDHRYAIDDTKIRTELGWSHRIDLEQGIQLTIDYYLN